MTTAYQPVGGEGRGYETLTAAGLSRRKAANVVHDRQGKKYCKNHLRWKWLPPFPVSLNSIEAQPATQWVERLR